MWVAELRVWHEGALQLELSKELDVEISSFYLNAFQHGRQELISKVMSISGKDKAEFISRMEADPRVKFFHAEGDQLYYCIAPNKIFHNAVLDRSIFFVKPLLCYRGFEYWTVASWNKGSIHQLVQRIRHAKRFAKVKLLSLSQQPLNFFIPAIFSELTEKQRQVITLAFENGYYSVPRNASVEELAKLANVPRTTFQEHLRKAEAKLLPAIISQLTHPVPKDARK